jgi:CRP-like cAMP-binding protein
MKGKFALAGSLDFLNLAEVLQLLGTNGSTGVLHMKSKFADAPGLIYILDGNPANASNGTLTGLDALYSLFGWLEGEFEFKEEPVTVEKEIKKNRMEIILDSLRMLDDGQIDKLGPVSLLEVAPDETGQEAKIPFMKGPLVDYMYVVDEEGFPNGEKITQEGKHGTWIWVVLEGTVEIVKETSRGPMSLIRLGDGAFIGSIASFLIEGCVRGATVVAVGDVQMGVLDSQRLATEYSCLSAEFRELLLSLDQRLRQATKKATGAMVGKHALEESMGDKELLIKQGDNFGLLSITNGQASVVRSTDHGDVLLADLTAGDFVGHVPFLDIGHEPHSASVYVSEDFEANQLDVASLQQEYNQVSTAWRNIIEHTRNCISVTTSLACDYVKSKE